MAGLTLIKRHVRSISVQIQGRDMEEEGGTVIQTSIRLLQRNVSGQRERQRRAHDRRSHSIVDVQLGIEDEES